MRAGLFIVILATAVNAQAKCADVDLNKGDSPFKKIPVYDQDGAGTCYAHAAVQIIDYYRFKKGEAGLTNPVYAAWAERRENSILFTQRSTEGGHVKNVVTALKGKGACSDEEVKKRIGKYADAAGLDEAEFLTFLEETYKPFGFLTESTWKKVSEALAERSKKTSAKPIDNYQLGLICEMRSKLEDDKLFGIAPTTFLTQAFDGCKTSPIQVPKLVTIDPASRTTMGNVLDKYLSHKAPSAITFCHNVFDTKDYFSYGFGCRPHAALVVGSRRDGEKCDYLVRNSHGAHWRPKYSKGCACIRRDGTYKDVCKQDEIRETVGCWIEGETLTKNLMGIDVFKGD